MRIQPIAAGVALLLAWSAAMVALPGQASRSIRSISNGCGMAVSRSIGRVTDELALMRQLSATR
jgi:hypothetical protein